MKFWESETEQVDFSRIKEGMDHAAAVLKKADSFEQVKEAFQLYNQCHMKMYSEFGIQFLKLYHDVSDQNTAVKYGELLEGVDKLTYYAPFAEAVIHSSYLPQIKSYYGEVVPKLFENGWHNYLCEQDNEIPDLNQISQQYQMLVTSLNYQYEGKKVERAELYRRMHSSDELERRSAGDCMDAAYLEHANEFDDLLSGVIDTNERIRTAYGYSNYCDYSNQMYSRFDYTQQQMVELCEQIMREMVPVYEAFQEKYREELKQEAPKPKELKSAVREFTKRLGREASEYWTVLEKNGYLDLESSQGKMPNVGCQRFIEKWGAGPLVMNSTESFSDGWVLVHEFGHSLQEKAAFEVQDFDLNVIASVDLMEISSRAMELLLYFHSECLYQEPDQFKIHHMNSLLRSLCLFAFGTIYENWLYQNTKADAQERKEMYIKLYRDYFPEDKEVTDDDILIKLYDDCLTYTIPNYQFSYVLGWIHAVQIICGYPKNQEAVWEQYMKLGSNLAFYSYGELLERFHLQNAFEPGTIQLFKKQLNVFLPVCEK